MKRGICMILIAVLFLLFFMPEFANCKSSREEEKASPEEGKEDTGKKQ